MDRLTIAGEYFVDKPARIGSDDSVDLTGLDQDNCLPFDAHGDRDGKKCPDHQNEDAEG